LGLNIFQIGFWFLVFGFWWLVVGGWWLVVGFGVGTVYRPLMRFNVLYGR